MKEIFPANKARDLISGGEIDWSESSDGLVFAPISSLVEFVLNLVLMPKQVSLKWDAADPRTHHFAPNVLKVEVGAKLILQWKMDLVEKERLDP